MLFNLLIPFLTDLFRKQPFQSGESHESLLMLKQTLRKEISAQLFKIFTGLILTSVIIIALAKLFTALNIYIEQFQNPQGLQMLTFGLVAIISVGLLVVLFKGDDLMKKKMPEPEPPKNQFDTQSLLLKFIEGVVQGFEKNRPLKTNDSSST